MKRCILILGLLTLGTAIAAPKSSIVPGVIVRTAALKETASFNAKSLTSLAPGARVNVLERQGGWQKVNLQSGTNVQGWVRSYEVRTDIEAGDNPTVIKSKGSEDGVLGGLAGLSRASTGLFGRRAPETSGRDGMVATIGVRGLSEADLEKAKPNPEEFAKWQQYAVTAEIAKRYAQAGKLRSNSIEPLPTPEPERKKKKK